MRTSSRFTLSLLAVLLIAAAPPAQAAAPPVVPLAGPMLGQAPAVRDSARESSRDSSRDSTTLGFAQIVDSLHFQSTLSPVPEAFSVASVSIASSASRHSENSHSPFNFIWGLPFLGFAGALTKERDTLARSGSRRSHPVATGVKIFQGSLVMLDGGFAKPGAAATGKIALGRAVSTVDNTAGADGDMNIEVEVGEFLWANSAAGDLIAGTEVGTDCYIVDDQTVAKTNGSASRSRAGKVTGVDARGVWVLVGIPF